MTSTSIYSHTAQDRTPYVYLIGWTAINKWYYGRRTAKGCHPSELWLTYFTSSKEVKKFRALYGEPDVILVRRTFGCPKKCAKWENTALRRLDAAKSPTWLNKTNGDYKFIADETTGEKSAATRKARGVKPWNYSGDNNRHHSEMMSVKMADIRANAHKWRTTKGYTNEYRDEHGMGKLTGRPVGTKDSEETKAKKRKSLADRAERETFVCQHCGKVVKMVVNYRKHIKTHEEKGRSPL